MPDYAGLNLISAYQQYIENMLRLTILAQVSHFFDDEVAKKRGQDVGT
jgi:hypothetical protein